MSKIYPSVFKMISNFSKELGTYIAQGAPNVTEEDYKERLYSLANKYNLSLKKIEEIVNYQFKYTTKIMKAGKFEVIRLPYFGKFSVNPKRIEHINKLKNESK